jgi:methylated-DNA-[protein]-cysteine S-methyltransferase
MLHQGYYSTVIQSPVGALQLTASEKGLCGVYFDGDKHHEDWMVRGAFDGRDHSLLQKTASQLGEYFAGTRQLFDVPLDMQGTIFQISAWKELQRIPYGETISYGEQARRIGDAKKARAVGAANGRNPISIIVPCHRVIGNSGALVGFGGGLKTKSFLLEHEIIVKAGNKAVA